METSVDWSFAQTELLEKQGVDLRKEMDAKLKDIEERYKREKEESDQLFEQHRKVRPAAREAPQGQTSCSSSTARSD